MQYLSLVSSLILCFVLQACIEGDEEVWIEENGSARVKATYRLPAPLLSKKEAADFVQAVDLGIGANPNLDVITNRVDMVNGQRVIRLEIKTDDFTKLESMTSGSDSVEKTKSSKILYAILGQIKLRMDGLKVGLDREVDLNPLLEEYVGSNAKMMLENAEFRYAVHLPVVVKASNAHQVSEDGKTLRWRYNLAQLDGAAIKMEMQAPVPLPWWVYLVGAIIILSLVAIVFWLIKKIRV